MISLGVSNGNLARNRLCIEQCFTEAAIFKPGRRQTPYARQRRCRSSPGLQEFRHPSASLRSPLGTEIHFAWPV